MLTLSEPQLPPFLLPCGPGGPAGGRGAGLLTREGQTAATSRPPPPRPPCAAAKPGLPEGPGSPPLRAPWGLRAASSPAAGRGSRAPRSLRSEPPASSRLAPRPGTCGSEQPQLVGRWTLGQRLPGESPPLAAPFQLARSLGSGLQVARELRAGLVLRLTMPEGAGASGLGPGRRGLLDGLPPSCQGDGGVCRGPRGVRQGSWGREGRWPGAGLGAVPASAALGCPSDLPQDPRACRAPFLERPPRDPARPRLT